MERIFRVAFLIDLQHLSPESWKSQQSTSEAELQPTSLTDSRSWSWRVSLFSTQGPSSGAVKPASFLPMGMNAKKPSHQEYLSVWLLLCLLPLFCLCLDLTFLNKRCHLSSPRPASLKEDALKYFVLKPANPTTTNPEDSRCSLSALDAHSRYKLSQFAESQTSHSIELLWGFRQVI